MDVSVPGIFALFSEHSRILRLEGLMNQTILFTDALLILS